MILQDSKELLARAYFFLGQWKRQISIFIFFVSIFTAIIFSFDAHWLPYFISAENSRSEDIAQFLSFWGDFQTGTLITVAFLWFVGFILKNDYWKRTALACLFAAVTAGIVVNIISFASGRPRPSTGIADGFYGIKTEYAYHSFPSGHSATSFGTATALAVAFPPAALPALTAAGAIAWSRLSLNRHYPSDIWMGGMIGIFFGVLFGAAARKTKGDTTLRS